VPEIINPKLKQVNINAQRLLQLINQLMDFRKIQKDKMYLNVSKLSMNAFLGKIVNAFETLVELKNLNIKFHPLLDGEDETWFDFRKVEDVLYNLLSNAIKKAPQNGTIDVGVKLSNKDPLNSLNIWVSDNGPGISEEHQELIFDRFYQVENEQDSINGTGIGLALAKEIVNCHRGNIFVESEPNKGTSFIIELPVRKSCFSEAELSDIEHIENSDLEKKVQLLESELSNTELLNVSNQKIKNKIEGRDTILIVEDNYELREFISVKLYEKYNILEAANGQEGLDLSNKNNPDVIISDIMMPKLNGLELCQKIKSNLNTSHIPVILLTAKGEIDDEINGLEHGADRYMSKPFRFELLEANIINLIESRKILFESFRLQQKIDVSVLATTPVDDNFLKKIIDIIEENMDNSDFNVTSLAEKIIISRGHLHKKLVALANLTPVDFINHIRLKKSLDMLENTAMKISEIGYAVGYSDPKYFSRLFKKQFGKSPSEYQRMNNHTIN
jgi:DNA-binding response OmpR family regulator